MDLHDFGIRLPHPQQIQASLDEFVLEVKGTFVSFVFKRYTIMRVVRYRTGFINRKRKKIIIIKTKRFCVCISRGFGAFTGRTVLWRVFNSRAGRRMFCSWVRLLILQLETISRKFMLYSFWEIPTVLIIICFVLIPCKFTETAFIFFTEIMGFLKYIYRMATGNNEVHYFLSILYFPYKTTLL